MNLPVGHEAPHERVPDLTDALNATTDTVRAADLIRLVIHPETGLLERLADFFEAAAEHARGLEADDGFDLHYEFQDAAAALRDFGNDLQEPVRRLRSLGTATPQRPHDQAPAEAATKPPPVPRTAAPVTRRR
ncbi:hypothetical protein [Streptomyces sp. RFCAC02]|uniref:hypothetical protein n=1 Tax=Streptomyces sp. RFCAC02 TaxID=2499143 RepID=UPI001021D363|nr:hypothetical protein [Streptomyces sp. RFCAC02]